MTKREFIQRLTLQLLVGRLEAGDHPVDPAFVADNAVEAANRIDDEVPNFFWDPPPQHRVERRKAKTK